MINTAARCFSLCCLLVLTISCGGGGSTTPTDASTATLITPAGGKAVSKDGKLTLQIPAGALTGENTITIRKLSPTDLPSEFAGFVSPNDIVYEFGPDGLTFDVPVTITFELDENPNKGNGKISSTLFTLISNGAPQIFLLEGMTQEINTSTGKVTISGQLSHFSVVKTYESEGDSTISLTDVPEEATKGEVFSVNLLTGSDITYKLGSSGVISSVGDANGNEKGALPGAVGGTNSMALRYKCDDVGDGTIKAILNKNFMPDLADLLISFRVEPRELSITAPVKCIAGSGNESGADWASANDASVADAGGGGKTVTVTMDGLIPANVRDDGFERAHAELKFLRDGGDLGIQKLDFFSIDDAWRSCKHLDGNSLPFTPVNGDTCSLSGDKFTFAWDQSTNCFDRIEFYIQAVGGEGGSSLLEKDLATCPP